MKAIRKIRSPNPQTSMIGNVNIEQIRESDIKFIEQHGYKVKEDEINGWCKLKHNVLPHTDEGGRCFLYCSAGSGVLTKEKYQKPILLKAGEYCVFNDMDEHGFLVLTDYATLLVANVRKIKSCKTKNTNYNTQHKEKSLNI